MKHFFMRVMPVLCLCASLLFCYTGCALPVSAEDLTGNYTRQAHTTTLSSEEKETYTDALVDFTFRFFGTALQDETTKDIPNRMVSPLSAVMCLALLTNGAGGNTKAQLEQLTGLPAETLNKFLYNYWMGLPVNDDCKVALANSVWYRNEADRLTVKPEFLQTVKDWYEAQVYAAPFDSSTVKDINNWCKTNTDGMIDKIIDKIDEDTVMYLINALVFDAKWAEEYEKEDIQERMFTNADGSTAQVQMLYSNETFYVFGDGCEGFIRPYKGNEYSFVGLLPTDGSDAVSLAASLTGDVWQKMWTDAHTQPEGSRFPGVQAGIPEFKFDFSVELNETLKKLGATDMFDGEMADFTPMATSTNGNIHCSLVKQKTFIELDRNGTKAAAITWAEMTGECYEIMSEKTVILDRPFVYAIVDNTTGLPLFIGVVTNLS